MFYSRPQGKPTIYTEKLSTTRLSDYANLFRVNSSNGRKLVKLYASNMDEEYLIHSGYHQITITLCKCDYEESFIKNFKKLINDRKFIYELIMTEYWMKNLKHTIYYSLFVLTILGDRSDSTSCFMLLGGYGFMWLMWYIHRMDCQTFYELQYLIKLDIKEYLN